MRTFVVASCFISILLSAQLIRAEEVSLFKAIESNDEQEVKRLIAENHEIISKRDVQGYWPVQKAVRQCSIPITQILIDSGASLSVENEQMNEFYALHVAAINCDTDMIDFLLNKGMDINLKSRVDHWTPLQRAVSRGKDRVSKYLVSKGADLNAKLNDSYERTPLSLAIQNKNLDLVEFLISHGANVNQGHGLLIAVEEKNEALAKLLVQKGADVNKDVTLSQAVGWGNKEMVEFLINHGADTNLYIPGTSQTPLSEAIRIEDLEMVKFLILKGADVNQPLNSIPLIQMAIAYSNVEMVQLLVKLGAKTGLFVQAALGNIEKIKSYSDLKDLTHKRGAYGWTLLDVAIKYGHLDLVAFLIDKGSDVNDQTSQTKDAPLHFAFNLSYKDMVIVEEKKHSIPRIQEEIIELLLQKGADINAKNSEGTTVLHKAVAIGDTKIVQLLLEKGADRNARLAKNLYVGAGWTPLDVAKQHKNQEMIQLLLKK